MGGRMITALLGSRSLEQTHARASRQAMPRLPQGTCHLAGAMTALAEHRQSIMNGEAEGVSIDHIIKFNC
jgi:hypothetical protein